MIYRTMDPTFANDVANHPEVRPFLGGADGPLDLTALVQNPANYVLEVMGAGVWLLQATLDGVYSLHTLMLPEARGRSYFANAKDALDYMFARTDCLEIVTQCPDDNPGARMAASLVGFRERFRREGAWHTGAGISYRSFTIEDWYVRSRACVTHGRQFHEALHAAKESRGIIDPQHPEDEAHDRAVGAAYMMAKSGNLGKAIGFYGRWAIIAGYRPIVEVGCNVIDTGDALIYVGDGEMEFLRLGPAA